jgi:hypothetical protein
MWTKRFFPEVWIMVRGITLAKWDRLAARIVMVGLFSGLMVPGSWAAENGPVDSAAGSDPPGTNVALGAKYTLWPAPNYVHCTDPGDAIQLTDGQTTTDYFWTQTSTVGWSSAAYVVITVDLGRLQPISGVSFNTAAGVAQVTWPAAIRILTSDDGQTYHHAGDLVELDRQAHGPFPDGYAIRRLATDRLQTRGRYVRFVAIPPAGGSYLFVDEVEVFRGSEGLLSQPPAGEVVGEVADLFIQWRSRSALSQRFQNDVSALEARLREAVLPDEKVRNRLLDRLEQVRAALDPAAVQVDGSFRAVLPLNQPHRKLFQLQAELWRAMGHAPWVVVGAQPWDPLDPFAPPEGSAKNGVQVHAMRGEYRAAAVNVYNATEEPITALLSFEGLPDPIIADGVMVYQVDWTDTGRGLPVAAALMETPRSDSGWKIDIPAGLVRQVWLNFHVPRGEASGLAGRYQGRIVLSSPATESARKVPLGLNVYPIDFPETTTLHLGGWSYTNGRGAYGITPDNRAALVRHLQQRYVNTPWATRSVLMNYQFSPDDPDRIHLNTEELDAWLAEWPDARRYMVFLAIGNYSGTSRAGFAGATLGTPEFDQRVGTWISAWVRHLRAREIEPDRLGLLIHDEPHEGSEIEPLIAWSRAIRAAEPEVRLWLDPTYRQPAQAPSEVFESSDVLCPNRPMWLAGGAAFADFFRDQQRRGKELQLYSCSGPARLLDPYAYYRLQAWQCWREGATGTFFWAFGDNSGASSWNEYLARSGPYTPLMLDDTRVVPSKQMEAIRESVQDYETLRMLQQKIQRAERTGRFDPVVVSDRQWLTAAVARVLDADCVTKMDWHEPKDRSLADTVRAGVLQRLVADDP